MPLGALDGVGLGCRARVVEAQPAIHPTEAWLGRVINALGEPIDGKGPLPIGRAGQPLRRRRRLRMPAAGSAARSISASGRSTPSSAAAGPAHGHLRRLRRRQVGDDVDAGALYAADVNVIGLIGGRGREVQEFVADDLGEEGLARSVVVVATSDGKPLMRRRRPTPRWRWRSISATAVGTSCA